MNKAEIMTLQASKVADSKIRIAIMAGKLSGILFAADRAISEATQFGEKADWKEMLRIMEGTLDAQTDIRADEHDDMTRSKRY